MNPIIIYHANCLDGFAAAYAAWRVYGDNATYIPAHYNDSDDVAKILAECAIDRELFILDFSFPLDVLELFKTASKHITMLDHHKTAFEMLNAPLDEPFEVIADKQHFYLNNAKSGCILAWEYFNDEPPPLAFQHIDDRDRWVFAIQGSKEFNAALWNHSRDFRTWEKLFTQDGVKQLYQEGEALLKEQAAHVEACAKRARLFELADKPGLIVNTDKDISEVGHRLAKDCGTFGMIWYIDKNGQANCSLRSTGDYDVSVIAKQFGGGGHKNAAGFKLSMKELFELLA